MAPTVTICAETLETLVQAAFEWRQELVGYVIPASHDFGDEESAESQDEQAGEISAAIDLAHDLITESRKD